MLGYARTSMTDEQLRTMISKTLTCRIDKRYCRSCLITILFVCLFVCFYNFGWILKTFLESR